MRTIAAGICPAAAFGRGPAYPAGNRTSAFTFKGPGPVVVVGAGIQPRLVVEITRRAINTIATRTSTWHGSAPAGRIVS